MKTNKRNYRKEFYLQEKRDDKNKQIIWIVKRFIFLIPLAIAFLLLEVAKHNSNFVEYTHINYIFAPLVKVIGGATSLVPIALTELLIFLALPVILLLIILFIKAVKKTNSKGKLVAKVISNTSLVLSILFLVYTLGHGINYYRNDIYSIMGYTKGEEYTINQLYEVTAHLAKNVTQLREQVSVNENGNMVLSEPIKSTLANSQSYIKNAKDEYSFLSISNVRPKGVIMSNLWSHTRITGMYMPITFESYINTDVPQWTIPHTIAHEIAHTNGFAREDEANFLGYLLAVKSDNIDFKYSATLFAFQQLSNSLYSYDENLWEKSAKLASQDVWNDIIQNNDYWKQFEGKVAEISSSVNDNFLKVQGQNDGIISYTKSVELILCYYNSLEFFN